MFTRIRQQLALGALLVLATMGASLLAAEEAIVVEGEDLVTSAGNSGGGLMKQDMSPYSGTWSGGAQLYWTPPGAGSTLALSPPVAAGDYEATLWATFGPQYGQFEVLARGVRIPKSDNDLIGHALTPGAQIWLGTVRLGGGAGLTIRILGRHPQATGFAVGIDKLVLRRKPAALIKLPLPPPSPPSAQGPSVPPFARPVAADPLRAHSRPRRNAAGLASPIVIEGEDLLARATPLRGQVAKQGMSAHGPQWSGAHQLYWTGGQKNSILPLPLDMVPAGRYEVTLFASGGPSFARFDVLAGSGAIPGSDVDMYGQGIWGPARVRLGVQELGPERGLIALRLTGRHAQATGFDVGIDRIVLRPTGSAPTANEPLAP